MMVRLNLFIIFMSILVNYNPQKIEPPLPNNLQTNLVIGDAELLFAYDLSSVTDRCNGNRRSPVLYDVVVDDMELWWLW